RRAGRCAPGSRLARGHQARRARRGARAPSRRGATAGGAGAGRAPGRRRRQRTRGWARAHPPSSKGGASRRRPRRGAARDAGARDVSRDGRVPGPGGAARATGADHRRPPPATRAGGRAHDAARHVRRLHVSLPPRRAAIGRSPGRRESRSARMTVRRSVSVLAACLVAAGVGGATRDPFAPPVAGSTGPEGTPLQRIDVGRLRLVAVVSDTNVARALLEDETGLGYIATLGTPVGRRGGVVSGIGRGWLRILEPGDGGGDPQPSAIVLEMSNETSMAERR